MFGKQIPSRMMFIALISTLLLTTTLLAGRTLAERAEEQGIRGQSEITITYTYDDASRLVGVDYGEGQGIAYTYDNAGNLLRRKVTVIMKVYLPMLLKGR